MASAIPAGYDDSRIPCPACQDGIAYVRAVRCDGSSKILFYVCATCEHRCSASAASVDEWWMRPDSRPRLVQRGV
jgi:hypothetical protein